MFARVFEVPDGLFVLPPIPTFCSATAYTPASLI